MAANMTPGKRGSFQTHPPQGSSTATATLPSRAKPTHQQIAERARAVWKSKGCPKGQDEKNWLEAEAQLKTETGAR